MDKLEVKIIEALREATTREAVENIFLLNAIDSAEAKTNYIKEAMHNPDIFYSTSENISMEQQYELILQMLLARSWTLYDYYEKLGLVQHAKCQ